jgi:hypothetical protein
VAAGLAKLPKRANLPRAWENLPTQTQAAEMLNVFDRSLRTAKTVEEQCSPELITAFAAARPCFQLEVDARVKEYGQESAWQSAALCPRKQTTQKPADPQGIDGLLLLRLPSRRPSTEGTM